MPYNFVADSFTQVSWLRRYERIMIQTV